MENIEQEIWKDIPGFEGKYMISSLGGVKSMNFRRGGIEKSMKIITIRLGYKMVNLCIFGKKKSYKIHRLVSSAFLGLDLNNSKQLACHNDDNPSNNRVDNLFVGTSKDNSDDMVRKGRGNTPKPITQFGLDGKFIKNWSSINEIRRIEGFNIANILGCLRGKTKHSYKYIWEYTQL